MGGITVERVLALLLWKQRHTNPEMSVIITPEDFETLKKCEEYQKLKADVTYLTKHQGDNATTFVNLVVDGTLDAFKAIESTEQDYQAAERAKKLQAAKQGMAELVNIVKGGMARGEYSDSTINELADAALLVARS